MSSNQSYIPGMCNINTAEVAMRRKAMWFGVVLSVLALAVLFLLNVSWWISLIALFVPVYIAVIGYLQVRNKFCVSYGSTGRQNADEQSEAAQIIDDSDALKADKAKTRSMNMQAIAITISVSLVLGVILDIL